MYINMYIYIYIYIHTYIHTYIGRGLGLEGFRTVLLGFDGPWLIDMYGFFITGFGMGLRGLGL